MLWHLLGKCETWEQGVVLGKCHETAKIWKLASCYMLDKEEYMWGIEGRRQIIWELYGCAFVIWFLSGFVCCYHVSQLGLIRHKLVRWEERDDRVGGSIWEGGGRRNSKKNGLAQGLYCSLVCPMSNIGLGLTSRISGGVHDIYGYHTE